MLIFICLFLPPLIIGVSLILKYKPDRIMMREHPGALRSTLIATLSPVIILLFLNLIRLVFDYEGVCVDSIGRVKPCDIWAYLFQSLSLKPGVDYSGFVALSLLSISVGCLVFGLASAHYKK